MFRCLLKHARCLTAFAVAVLACLMGGSSVQAGCGDHGYVVQRDNGEVVVVTPSNPGCPCKGPSCQKREVPPAPMTPPAPTRVVQDAIQQLGWAMGGLHLVDLLLPPRAIEFGCGYPSGVFQPPRA
ncbi:MAG: hypothetical protein ACKOS8_09480 [Gemmataceae bacterium]